MPRGPVGYGGSFDVGYSPGMTTRTRLQMPEIPPVEGMDLGGLLNAVARARRMRAGSQASSLGQRVPQAAPVEDPVRRFWTIKSDLDRLQSQDPWAGRAYGQAQGLGYFNMPAASALAFGKDVFPSGFDTYTNILGASRSVNPVAQAEFGTPSPGQTQVEYDKEGRPVRSTERPGRGGWGASYTGY